MNVRFLCCLALAAFLTVAVAERIAADYYGGSVCSPADQNTNCNNSCLPGQVSINGVMHCAVMYQGNDRIITFRVCVRDTQSTGGCHLETAYYEPVTCVMQYRDCGAPVSSGTGCQHNIGFATCNCDPETESDGEMTGDSTQTCT